MITSTTIAGFLAKNFDKISAAYGKADEALQIAVKSAYSNYLTNSASKFSKSKSFFIRNQPTDLYEYYVPIGIHCHGTHIQEPTIAECLQQNTRLIIKGSGGSGKSVLIKHLFLDCIRTGGYAPILVELRDLNAGESSLDQAISETLDSFGFKTSGDYIEKSKKNGSFCFFFDGYDEVIHSRRSTLMREIKKLSRKYPLCPIIISSRPDDMLNGIDDFSIFNVLPLDLQSAKGLITKLPYDEEIKTKFCARLANGLFEEHQSFLSNPLLLSIMLLTYGENSEIPSKLSLFYNQAYEALFQRHDAYKGGYSRDRLTSLDIQDFGRVFSVFSLQTYDRSEFRVSRTSCLNYITKSKQAIRQDFKPEDYLSDLLAAACLLIEDGLDIAYAHRSFQEYFVALHISTASPQIQEKLLNRYWKRMRSDLVIELLYEINPGLVERTLMIPKLAHLVSSLGIKNKPGITHATRLFKLIYKSLWVDERGIRATLKSGEATEMDVAHLAIKMCSDFKFPPAEVFDKLKAQLLDELGGEERSFEIESKHLSYRSRAMQLIGEGMGSFSITYLRAIVETYHNLCKKHANGIENLDDLLGM